MNICLLDPGLQDNTGMPSLNLGDLIIQEAVKREIVNIFGEGSPITHIATHAYLTQEQIKKIRLCELVLVGGTNLLSSRMHRKKRLWKVNFKDAALIMRPVLLGVGWGSYQGAPNLYTRLLYKVLLSRQLMHSVRDSYTKAKLHEAGIKNVLNTGCPSMWPFLEMRSEEIPVEKSENALLMLTDYNKKPELDKRLVNLIASKYRKVYIWPQGSRDLEYFNKLTSGMSILVNILEHSYECFTKFLASGVQFDYIGTRLHGGIKCLLANKRSLIIEIDNRATEIAKDTQLPTTPRSNFEYIEGWIAGSEPVKIKINADAINSWRSQFARLLTHRSG